METSDTLSAGSGHPPAPAFAVAQAAVARIALLLAEEKQPGAVFRVAVLGGGCSGFQYQYSIDHAPPAESDFLLRQDGAAVAVDDVSLGLLHAAVLDYEEDLSSAGFVIRNPNATARCGCGNSFSVA